MQTNKTITLDVQSRSYVIVNAKQGDSMSRTVTIYLTENGETYPIPEGKVLSVFYTKPDGTKGYYTTLPDGSTAVENNGSHITLILAPQALTVAGRVKVHVEINEPDFSAALNTFSFIVDVEKNDAYDAESEDYWNVPNFEQIKNAVDQLILSAVKSVNEQIPDENGNIHLDAQNIYTRLSVDDGQEQQNVQGALDALATAHESMEKLREFQNRFLDGALDTDGIVLAAVNTLASAETELQPATLEATAEEYESRAFSIPTTNRVKEMLPQQDLSFGTLPDGTEDIGYCDRAASPTGKGGLSVYHATAPLCIPVNYAAYQGKQLKSVEAVIGSGLSLTFSTVRKGTTAEYRKLFTITGEASEDGSVQHKKETFDLTNPESERVQWHNTNPGLIEIGNEEMLAVSANEMGAAMLWAGCYTAEEAKEHGFYTNGDVASDIQAHDLNIRFGIAEISPKVKRKEGKSVVEEKTVSILGDSISTYMGWNPAGNAPHYNGITDNEGLPSVSQTWWKRAADALGLNVLVNEAEAGGLCSADLTADLPEGYEDINILAAYKRVEQLTANDTVPDVIWLEIGTNDFLQGVSLGTYDGTAEPAEEPSEFREAFARTLLNLQTAYPKAKIYAGTILPTWDGSKGISGTPSVNAAGIPLATYNGAIREISAMFGAEVIDFAACGINYSNLSTYMGDYDADTGKAIHPNAAGHALMANAVIKTLDPFCRFRSIEEE